MTDTLLADGDDFEARINAQVPGLRLPPAPRRFAICGFNEDDLPVLAYWGMETAGQAVAVLPGGGSTRISESAERMHQAISTGYDVRLVWLDPARPG